MEYFELLERHRSIRKYKSDPVPEAVLQKVLGAALRASSSGNMQTYSIIVTSDLEIRKKLFNAHFQQKMLLEAPLLITFCSDFHRMREWLKVSEAPDNFDNFMSFMIGGIDAVLASQNVALAAQNEGLSICYMGTTLASCDEIAKILECPPNVVPVAGFVLGYGDEAPAQRDRLPLSGVVHRETYQDYSPDEIRKVYQEREINGWNRYLAYPDLKKKIVESGVKNLGQLYTTVKYTKESHIEYSNRILNCLKRQDYFNQ